MRKLGKYIACIVIVLAVLWGCKAIRPENRVLIGMCSDVHLPTMHDSEYRITTFVDSMKLAKPDFIIELGDFGTPAPEYAHLFDIWNSFPGDKYHVIGNHEMDGGYSLKEALEYRKMKSSWYSFDKNGFRFIALDGNDRKPGESRGYKQYIGPVQQEWLKSELAASDYPMVIFSHQGLSASPGAEESYGIENHREIQKILEQHNQVHPGKKVIACFNGHTHYDYAENINGIWFITINSMAYQWMGEEWAHVRYSEDVDREFRWIKYTAPHKEPLFTLVEISDKGHIKIFGKETEWEGPSPWDLGYPEELKAYVRPAISPRTLKFDLN